MVRPVLRRHFGIVEYGDRHIKTRYDRGSVEVNVLDSQNNRRRNGAADAV